MVLESMLNERSLMEKGKFVKFSGRRLVGTGIILGMILSFLLSQPTVMNGFLSLMGYLYSFLPDSLARFLRGQTFLAFTFFWALMFVGIIMWILRGDFFRAENYSRRDQFRVVDEEPDVEKDSKKDKDL